MSKWKEIRNDYFDEDQKCVNIDAWLTDDDDEEGKVIAKVYVDGEIGTIYFDEDAKLDLEAQESIGKVIRAMEGGAYSE